MALSDWVSREIRGLKEQMPKLSKEQVAGINPLRIQGLSGQIELSALGWYVPAVGDSAYVMRWGSTAFCLGATKPNTVPSIIGQVQTAPGSGATSVSVRVDGTVRALPMSAGLSLAANDSVLLQWGPNASGGWDGAVISKLGAAPTSVQPPTSAPDTGDQLPSGPSVQSPITIPAVATVTYRGGSVRGDTEGKVYQGDWTGRYGNNHTYVIYGGGFDQLRGRSLVRADLIIPQRRPGGDGAPVAPQFRLHRSRTIPGPEPATFGGFSGPGIAIGSGGVASSTTNSSVGSAAQSLMDGSYAGLALYYDGKPLYMALKGRSLDANAFAWRIWHTD